MANDSLKTAYDLLDLLEYSLRTGDGTRESGFPVGGIREIIAQIREIVGKNCDLKAQAESQSISKNGNSSKHFNGLSRENAVSVDLRAENVGARSYQSNSLELDRMDSAGPESAALERMSYMNIPKVRTVPPEARGKIRELVGIETDEVS